MHCDNASIRRGKLKLMITDRRPGPAAWPAQPAAAAATDGRGPGPGPPPDIGIRSPAGRRAPPPRAPICARAQLFCENLCPHLALWRNKKTSRRREPKGFRRAPGASSTLLALALPADAAARMRTTRKRRSGPRPPTGAASCSTPAARARTLGTFRPPWRGAASPAPRRLRRPPGAALYRTASGSPGLARAEGRKTQGERAGAERGEKVDRGGTHGQADSGRRQKRADGTEGAAAAGPAAATAAAAAIGDGLASPQLCASAPLVMSS